MTESETFGALDYRNPGLPIVRYVSHSKFTDRHGPYRVINGIYGI